MLQLSVRFGAGPGREIQAPPRPAPEHPGPRTGNGAGDNSGGPDRCTAFFYGAPPAIRCPARVPVFFGALSGAPLSRTNFPVEMRISGVSLALKIRRKFSQAGYSKNRDPPLRMNLVPGV